MRLKYLLGFGFLLISFYSFSRSIYVNPYKGSDDGFGDKTKPYKTIPKAMSLIAPGDTINLFPTVYHESIEFYGNKSGTSINPIVVDGHGAIIDGAMPIDEEEWHKIEDGLYKNTSLSQIKGFDIIRWGFFFDGILNRMNRTSKGFKAPLKELSELNNNEWTYDEHEKAFYIRIDSSKKLSDCDIKAPMLINGVGFGGCSYVVIKNITCSGVINDGFNIHGDCVGLSFENIVSKHCGDDGFSAHENAIVKVKGFTSKDNSTGVCNVNNSCSDMKDVLIKDCVGHDIFFPEGGVNIIRNCVILSTSQNVISVGAKPIDHLYSTLIIDNLLLLRKENLGVIYVSKGGTLRVDHSTLSGASLTSFGSLSLTNSAIGGPFNTILKIDSFSGWQADSNLYGFDRIDWNELSLKEPDFDRYKALSLQDEHSVWKRNEFDEKKIHNEIGVVFSNLPHY